MSNTGSSECNDKGSEASVNTEEDNKPKLGQNVIDVCNNADENHKCIAIFRVGKETQKDIKVHSCFLATKSPVMEKMFFGSLKNNNIIQIEDTEPDTFKSFVKFLYTFDENLITHENANGLLYLSSKYCIRPLFDCCEKFLATNLDLTNVASIFNTSILFNCSYLREKIFDFIIKNQSKLFPSHYLDDCSEESFKVLLESPYLSIAEDNIFVVLYSWVEVYLKRNDFENTNFKKVMEPFLKYIRLLSLSKDNCNFLLQNDICSDEIKKEVKEHLRRGKTLFFSSKYFSTCPRFAPFEALQYKTIWFSKESSCGRFSICSDEYVEIIVCAVYVKIISRELNYIQMNDAYSPRPPKDQTFVLPKMNPGYYMCFIPNNGFLMNKEGSAYISKNQPSGEIRNGITCLDIWPYLPQIHLFSNYGKESINIEKNSEIRGERACFLGCSYK